MELAPAAERLVPRRRVFPGSIRCGAGRDAYGCECRAEPGFVIASVGEECFGRRQGSDHEARALVIIHLARRERHGDGAAFIVADGLELGVQPASIRPKRSKTALSEQVRDGAMRLRMRRFNHAPLRPRAPVGKPPRRRGRGARTALLKERLRNVTFHATSTALAVRAPGFFGVLAFIFLFAHRWIIGFIREFLQKRHCETKASDELGRRIRHNPRQETRVRKGQFSDQFP